MVPFFFFQLLLKPFVFLQEDLPISKLLPSQKNSTLASSILNWVQNIKPKETPLPAVIIQECLTVYIKKRVGGMTCNKMSLTYVILNSFFPCQVDHVGKHILSKLMSDWKLIDELCVLRAIFLLGSGILSFSDCSFHFNVNIFTLGKTISFR